jgi:hypothetical protein
MIDENQLIFIISQPRAGSTMLQKLVSNNPKVHTASEPWLLLPLMSIYTPELITAKYNFKTAVAGIFDYLDKSGDSEAFHQGVKQLVLSLYSTQEAGQYFLDKTPRYYEILPEIYSLFPNAKYLVLRRNPFAVMGSMLETWVGRDLNLDKLMRFHRDFMVAPFKIDAFTKQMLGKQNFMEIRYEELVQEPVSFTRQIYQWLQLPYDEEVLQIGKNDKTKGLYGDDVYKTENKQFMDAASVEKWKDYASSDPYRRRFFGAYSNFLGSDFLKTQGYEPYLAPSSWMDRFKKDFFMELQAKIAASNQ